MSALAGAGTCGSRRPTAKKGAPVLRVPAGPARIAFGVLLLSVVVGVSPALASERKATGTDSAGDGHAGSNRDIVSTSFDYDDSGKVELTVTMAAPIDPQN